MMLVVTGCQSPRTYEVSFVSGCEGNIVKQCHYKGTDVVVEFVNGDKLVVESSSYIPDVKVLKNEKS